MTRTVSIVINTYNRADSLAVTLASLRQLDHPAVEVVVVNGPSTDGTDDVLAAHRGQVKVVSCPERNLSLSRNLGIAAAAGELVAFIDDDAYPDPAWLDDLVGLFDDDEVAAAGGPVLDHTGAELQAKYSLANRFGDAWVAGGPDPSDALSSPWSDAFVYPMGTNAVFRRERLVEVGGYDEVFAYYLDETDVCRRLLDRGHRIAAADRGWVYHKFLPSQFRLETKAVRDRFAILRSKAYFALRHARSHHSFFSICENLYLWGNHQDHDYRANVEQGLLSADDYAQFRHDLHRAYEEAFVLSQRPPAVRPPEFFAAPEPFLPFSTAGRAPGDGRLHICFVTVEYLPGQLNGIARVIHTMATGLARRGHVVRVITRGEDHDRVDLEEGVWVHRPNVLPPGALLDEPGYEAGLEYHYSVLRELRRIHARRPVDVVQVPNWGSEGLAVLREGTVPAVLGLYTPMAVVADVDGRYGGADDEAARWVAFERECYERAGNVLACGPTIVDEVTERYRVAIAEKNLRLVAHGLPRPPDPGPAARAVDGTHLVFVGRLEGRKGIDVLLDALPGLLERFPELVVSIAGDDTVPTGEGDTYRERFEASPAGRRHGDRVRFLGLVSDDERTALYRAADLLVMPSRYESFGLVLLEAMMWGVPVVASRVGGMAEIVEDGVCGRLVPPGDAAALEAALAELLADPERRAAMGAAALQRYEDHYTDARMVAGAERFYLEVAGRGAPSEPARRTPPDLASLVRCSRCGGPVEAWDAVVTEDGRRKTGMLVCPACRLTAAEVRAFAYDFHAGGRAAPPARPEPRRIPPVGERRIPVTDEVVERIGLWQERGRALVTTDPAARLVVHARCTDAAVRLLHHPSAGEATLRVDGRPVATVGLRNDEGFYSAPAWLLEDAPLERRRIEVEPVIHSRTGAPELVVEELLLLGPLGEPGFAPPQPINRGNGYSPVVERYLAAMAPDGIALEVGGGDRRRCHPSLVNFEYLAFDLADAYGDLHELPFRDASFDLVVSQAVFEHLADPFLAAREIVRVTKPGGIVVTEVAFLQPLHAAPHHYFNMTLAGVEQLFAGCEVLERDWFGSVADTVEWVLRAANVPVRVGEGAVDEVVGRLREAERSLQHDDLRNVAGGVYLVVRTPGAPGTPAP